MDVELKKMENEEEIVHNINCEPEIVISYFCNLDICEYCYARSQKIDEKMSIEDFEKLIGWFKDVVKPLKGITLLGGEPTALNDLKKYLDAAQKQDVYINFFTNGSFNNKQCEMLINSQVVKTFYFHLNENHLEKVKGHLDNFKNNIKKLKENGKNVVLRNNFDGNDFNYNIVLELASEFSLPIAWSITSPCKSMSNYVLRKDLRKVGERLGCFFAEARKLNLELNLLRPIPHCAFPDNIYEEFKDYTDLARNCNVSSYVYPNKQIQFCTVLDHFKSSIINSADELKDSILQFQKLENNLRKLPSFDTCLTCDKFKMEICQGGCFAYKFFGEHV